MRPPARTRRPGRRCRLRRPTPRAPRGRAWTSSRAPAGVSATRYSCGLISFATPIRMARGTVSRQTRGQRKGGRRDLHDRDLGRQGGSRGRVRQAQGGERGQPLARVSGRQVPAPAGSRGSTPLREPRRGLAESGAGRGRAKPAEFPGRDRRDLEGARLGRHVDSSSSRSRSASRRGARRGRALGRQPRRLTGSAFSAARSGRVVAGMTTSTRGSQSAHFSSACAQVSTPSARSGSSAARRRLASQERAPVPPSGRMTMTAIAELLCERQDASLRTRARAG